MVHYNETCLLCSTIIGIYSFYFSEVCNPYKNVWFNHVDICNMKSVFVWTFYLTKKYNTNILERITKLQYIVLLLHGCHWKREYTCAHFGDTFADFNIVWSNWVKFFISRYIISTCCLNFSHLFKLWVNAIFKMILVLSLSDPRHMNVPIWLTRHKSQTQTNFNLRLLCLI